MRDLTKVEMILMESVWISRWSDNMESLSAVLDPEEALEIVTNIQRDLKENGYEIVKKK